METVEIKQDMEGQETSMNELKTPGKIQSKFSCIVCNFNTDNKYKYNEHMKTNKHCIKTGEKEKSKFICNICSKIYATKQSLWKHKQTCKTNNDSRALPLPHQCLQTSQISSDIKDENNIKLLYLSNKSKKVIMDTCEYEKLLNQLRNPKTDRPKTDRLIPETSVGILGKSKNIIDILNENCKESYNICDWTRTIKVNLTQIVQYHKLNYSNIMSKLISDNLFCVPIKQRPILCIENEIYYKNNNTWRKMTNNKIASYIIKNVAEYGRREYYKYSEDPNYSEYTIALDRCFNYFKKLDNDISKITDKIIVNVISCKDNVLCIV